MNDNNNILGFCTENRNEFLQDFFRTENLTSQIEAQRKYCKNEEKKELKRPDLKEKEIEQGIEDAFPYASEEQEDNMSITKEELRLMFEDFSTSIDRKLDERLMPIDQELKKLDRIYKTLYGDGNSSNTSEKLGFVDNVNSSIIKIDKIDKAVNGFTKEDHTRVNGLIDDIGEVKALLKGEGAYTNQGLLNKVDKLELDINEPKVGLKSLVAIENANIRKEIEVKNSDRIKWVVGTFFSVIAVGFLMLNYIKSYPVQNNNQQSSVQQQPVNTAAQPTPVKTH